MLLIEAYVWLLPVTIALRIAGFRRVRWVAGRLHPRRTTHARSGSDTARLAAAMVQAASRRAGLRPNCLERSLTLWWLLRRHGIVADLHIGVRRVEHSLLAHAWVECDGAVLNDVANIRDIFPPFDGTLIPEQLS